MNKNCSLLEILPNEIFIQIFRYLNAEHIFLAFDNLNWRFNALLRNLDNLVFNFWDNNNILVNSFIPYVDTLTIHGRTNVNFTYFTIIRHLKIIWLTEPLLEQLDSYTLHFLEHLFVKKLSYNSAGALYEKVFSNTFPHLKFCYIQEQSKFTHRYLSKSNKFINRIVI